MAKIDLEIGDIVSVEEGHYCVIVDNRIMRNGRIKGIPISTDINGSALVRNIPLRKKFFDVTDEQGYPYKVTWYNDGHGKVSSMMTKYFAKNAEKLHISSGKIGHINKKGIKFIKKHANRMIIWDRYILELVGELEYV